MTGFDLRAALLAEVHCDWVTLRDKATQKPSISLCQWCGKLVGGAPVTCPVPGAIKQAAKEAG